MSNSIQIQLNKYQFYMTKLMKMMKKDNTETLRNAYQMWEEEYMRLMQYVAMPRLSDEEHTTLEIY